MIPILDFRLQASGKDPGGFADALGEACRRDGVFLLKEHGIPRGLLREVLEVSDEFFSQPEDQKSRVSMQSGWANRGRAAEGVEVVGGADGCPPQKESFSMGMDLPSQKADFDLGDAFNPPNIWPECDRFRDVMRDFYKEVLGLGRGLMHAVERDLELPYGFFQPHFSEPMATLRLSHYPARGSQTEPAVAGGATYDYGALTLVLTDQAEGIQFQSRDGTWRELPHDPGDLIVMVGDVLMHWTNDQYRSVPHRMSHQSKIRHLAAFYLYPNSESMIAPLPTTGAPRHAPMRAGEFLRTRLGETYRTTA
ncbi:isopenicillin N synthase family dioxygenase [Celeribacter litoreus]|uniref:isopenicillin N synthase family dioxygenase n=1 Tax=Celeribacter litoreus TaxID=2876714 RepID=UPI001CCF0133|nr:2-oxoglutarate and iron-dependent oxygenase domain-containing protein [Celeribacter litoreus]MCA0044452.1 isopenicillin N synthase family oxygenase [Celeribacter litoreus]